MGCLFFYKSWLLESSSVRLTHSYRSHDSRYEHMTSLPSAEPYEFLVKLLNTKTRWVTECPLLSLRYNVISLQFSIIPVDIAIYGITAKLTQNLRKTVQWRIP
jgi:hypothetical protein